MDARMRKLGILLSDTELAETLVNAGLDLPRKIRAAKKSDLQKIKGIGKATADKIKIRFGG